MRRALLIVVGMVAGSGWAAASTETILYDFQGGSLDGFYPSFIPLVSDKAGNLYGTTVYGGSGSCVVDLYTGCGIVYQLIPGSQGWSESILYDFQGGTDGQGPLDLTMDATGHLYGGATYFDHAACAKGCGIVYTLLPPVTSTGPWTKSVIYQFVEGDGAASVIAGSDGNLYGVTDRGGYFGGDCVKLGCGTVFKLAPPASAGSLWTKTTLYAFQGVALGKAWGDGSQPQGLTFDSQGNLYGSTVIGGHCYPSTGCFGTVFKLTAPSWTYSLIYRFADSDNAPVSVPVVDGHGNIFGTTSSEVYELSEKSGKVTRTVIGSIDYCYGGVIVDDRGDVLGTSSTGGPNNQGFVFQLKPPGGAGPWTENVLYSFSGSPDGGDPQAPLLLRNGVVYGTTYTGGSQGCTVLCGHDRLRDGV